MPKYRVKVENHTGYGEGVVEASSVEEACRLALAEIEVTERYDLIRRPEYIDAISAVGDDGEVEVEVPPGLTLAGWLAGIGSEDDD